MNKLEVVKFLLEQVKDSYNILEEINSAKEKSKEKYGVSYKYNEYTDKRSYDINLAKFKEEVRMARRLLLEISKMGDIYNE